MSFSLQRIRQRTRKNVRESISPLRFGVFIPDVLFVIGIMTWGCCSVSWTVPSSGHKHIFAYNVWTVCHKLIRLVSLDSVGHTESNEMKIPVNHFEFSHKVPYFTNDSVHSSETRDASLAPYSEGTQKMIMLFLKMLIAIDSLCLLSGDRSR